MAGLFNSTVLDVAIGLVFVYLLLAIICTAANEWISGLLRTRAKMLEKGLTQLLDDQKTSNGKDNVEGFLKEFYEHPLITGMMKGDKHPAYLSARAFSSAVTDIAMLDRTAQSTFANLQAGINSLPDGDVKKALVALLQRSGGNLD